jgi:UDP-hydrolysing UDP-N-acetyl-D-glucosamine 2-epimerase
MELYKSKADLYDKFISQSGKSYEKAADVIGKYLKKTDLILELAVTGEALMEEHGKIIEKIEKDGFKVNEIRIFIDNEEKGRPLFLGKFLMLLSEKIKKINPDIILVMGDRAEMMAGALAGVYFGIPVAHIHGGEVTSTADELIRHAITKLSTIHFTATKKSAERIIKMGENPKKVFITGAPGLINKKLSDNRKIFLAKKYKFDLTKPLILASQHSVDANKSVFQMRETMEALIKFSCPSIITVPNSDPGGKEMLKIIKSYNKKGLIRAYSNIDSQDYFDLMKIAAVLVGNSSSGIIEAPFLSLPFVNIGERQSKRERANNVIDVDYDRFQIVKAIKRAMEPSFKNKIIKIRNPYYFKNTEKKITDILSKMKIDKKILQKQITY